MFSDRSDIWSGIGAVLSTAVSVYGWFYSIGLASLFTFIAGALFTLATQERLEKKRQKREFDKKMTEHIYGPLHQELNSILKDLKNFQSPVDSVNRVATLENFMENYRYDLVNEELRYHLEEFQKRLQPYAVLWREARNETEIRTKRSLDKHEISGKITFVITAEMQEIDRTNIIELVFRNKTPLQFFAQKAGPYGTAYMIGYVGQKSEGYISKDHRMHKISMEITKELSKTPTIQAQRKEREHLLEECYSLIETIRKQIVLS